MRKIWRLIPSADQKAQGLEKIMFGEKKRSGYIRGIIASMVVIAFFTVIIIVYYNMLRDETESNMIKEGGLNAGISAEKLYGSLRSRLVLTILVASLFVSGVLGFMYYSGRKSIAAARLEEEKERAVAANEAKTAFLSNMSHEIRTPINAVLGMNEMILRECEDPDILKYAESVRTAGNTLLGLINDVLDFSKIEAGKIEILPVDYHVCAVLNDLVNMIKPRAAQKGLSLILDFDKDIPKQLHGDEVRIKQIITNILTNAVKYTENGSITFQLGFEKPAAETDHILLHVSFRDSGIGIKPEDMIIGAVSFGEEAQRLEDAGKAGDLDYIRGHQEEFMQMLSQFKAPLSGLFPKEENDVDRPEADAGLLEVVYDEIRTAAEDMDCDRLESIFSEMDAYTIPETEAERFTVLREMAERFDYEGMMKVLSSQMK